MGVSGISLAVLFWRQRTAQSTLLELGPFVLLIFCGYYLLPTVGIVVASSIDDRFQEIDHVGTIARLGTVFVAAFTIAYIFARGRARFESRTCHVGVWIDRDLRRYFFVLVISDLCTLMLRWHYGIGSGSSYIDQYAVVQQMPILAGQALVESKIFSWVAMILLVVSAMSLADWRRTRKILILLFFYFLVVMVVTQSRAAMVRAMLCFLVTYTFLRRPIPLRFQVVLGCVGMVLMNAFAAGRGGGYSSLADLGLLSLLVPGEVIEVYFNTYFLLMLQSQGEHFTPPGLSYIADLLSFIPSQISPFEKWNISSWYVETYFSSYADEGGGLAFGTLAEAVTNYGVVSVLVQGGGIGALCGLLVRWLLRKPEVTRFTIAIYVFVLSGIYYSIRVSTFGVVGGIISGFLLPYLVIQAFCKINNAKAAPQIPALLPSVPEKPEAT